jgi:hypothetical protein
MAITLGKDASPAPPFGTEIISANYTVEQEQIDVTNRSNMGGSTGGPGYRAYAAGFESKVWEIECHNATGLITQLETNSATDGYIVMGVTENIGIDGAVTFTVTAREA